MAELVIFFYWCRHSSRCEDDSKGAVEKTLRERLRFGGRNANLGISGGRCKRDRSRGYNR